MYKKRPNILMLFTDEALDKHIRIIASKRKCQPHVYNLDQIDTQKLEKRNIQLIILNIKDEFKGKKALRIIKKNLEDKNVPVLGIIQQPLANQVLEFNKLGLSDWIMAPFLMEELENRVGHYMDYVEILGKYKNNKMYFNTLLHNVPYMSWFKNKESEYIKVNKEFSYHSNKDYKTIEGRDDSFVWDGKIGEQCRIFDLKVMNERKQVVFNECIPGKRGDRLFEVHKAPVVNEYDEVIGTVGVARDITEQKKAQDQVEHMAYTDDLTQVNNRRGFYKYTKQLYQQKVEDITLFYIDLDDFKIINDSYGHYYGDQILIKIANKLKDFCQKGVVSRMGGDEFVIVFEEKLPRKLAEKKAQALINYISMCFVIDDKRHTTSTSVGIVQGSFKENTLEEMLTKGDVALYKAKEKGKQQFVFYTEELEEEHIFRMEIEKDLGKAIGQGEIQLYYQPQYTPYKQLVGFEALFRWTNEKYRHIPVIEIIKIMESSQLICEVGNYILKKALTFAKRINKNQEQLLIVSVNISILQLIKDDFLDKVKQLIKEIGVEPEMICMEITETVLLEDIDKNIEKIKKLKDLGIIISLDDFGTGYSSLNYLSRLPLNEMKIDKCFTSCIESSKVYRQMIKTIIEMAHIMDLKVVAEGIEDDAQLEILKEIKVDYIQGYLTGKPMREIDVTKMLEDML